MKGFKTGILLLILSVFFANSKAQTIEVIGGNVINGAVTGSLLGAATMALNNSSDFLPVRMGLGGGVIGGAAISIYDIATLPRGEQFYISGVFNDGSNSTIIILLDTFYGAAGGAIFGMAGMLIADKPLVNGLQYGSGIGAWTGFAFGLVDSFVLSRRNRDFADAGFLNRSSLLAVSSQNYRLEMGRPSIHDQPVISSGDIGMSYEPTVELFSLKMSF